MYRYRYLKKTSPSRLDLISFRLKSWKWFLPRKLLAFSLVILGIFLAGSAVWPIINYQVRYAPRFTRIYSPLSTGSQVLGSALAVSDEKGTKDYTLVSSWFVDQPRKAYPKPLEIGVASYRLTIPGLGITNALVKIGGEDLKRSLIQYAGPAPGEYGNVVIVGHSTLPQLFNPKNYLTIFSTLYQLKEGQDEVILEYGGTFYRYAVEEIFEVMPTDLSVLDQDYNRKCLILITCSPPGTYLRRLIVKACMADS
jgi:sortase A